MAEFELLYYVGNPQHLKKKIHLRIFETSPKSGRFVVDTLCDRIRAFHCRHPVQQADNLFLCFERGNPMF
jgi:hypothetical protein